MCRHAIIKNGPCGQNKWPSWLPHWPGSYEGPGFRLVNYKIVLCSSPVRMLCLLLFHLMIEYLGCCQQQLPNDWFFHLLLLQYRSQTKNSNLVHIGVYIVYFYLRCMQSCTLFLQALMFICSDQIIFLQLLFEFLARTMDGLDWMVQHQWFNHA